MSQRPHRSSRSLEVLTLFEPHRLHQQFLQAAYASVVPVSCRRLSTATQRVSVPENRDRGLLLAQKGARDE
jgi:hypothetical protein